MLYNAAKSGKLKKQVAGQSFSASKFLIKNIFTCFCYLIGFDACFYKPCKNHGVCVSGLGHDFFCQCPHGFQGQHIVSIWSHTNASTRNWTEDLTRNPTGNSDKMVDVILVNEERVSSISLIHIHDHHLSTTRNCKF